MVPEKEEKVLIVGSGPAGLAAAVYAARADLTPLVLAGEQPGGLLTYTSKVENFPGFPEGIQGGELMSRMLQQSRQNGARVLFEKAVKIELQIKPKLHRVTLSDGTVYAARALILAMGASPRRLGIPGEERLYGRGVSACAVCDGAFFAGQHVAVAGGGDSALEEALYLARYASHVTLCCRSRELSASPVMQKRALNDPKITIRYQCVPVEVLGHEKVEQLVVRDLVTWKQETLEVGGLFTAIGHVPQTQLVAGALPCDKAGYLLTATPSTATVCPGVFACGDCADPVYRQAVTAVGSGCRAALDARRYLDETPG